MSNYLTAQEAADLLGIRLPTLYAYVSRGLIRSEEMGGKSRAKQYVKADVEALLQKKQLRQNPRQAVEEALDFGTPILATAISLIQNGRFYYRSQDAVQLAKTETLERVAELLWQTEGVFADWAEDDNAWQQYVALAPLLDGLLPIEQFQIVLPVAASQDVSAFVQGQGGETAVRILRLLTITATGQPVQNSIADSLQSAWLPKHPQSVHWLNTALILCADHELNVSSFTARCIASAGATPYDAVIGGLSALRGSKHGGHTERVEQLLREAQQPKLAYATIASRLRRGEAIPGFGHRLYPEGDPRADVLLALAEQVSPERTQLVQAIVQAVWQTTQKKPTLDIGLVALTHALQLPNGSALALFALGRTVGWIGHTLEQYQSEQLIRPRATYSGLPPSSS